MTEFISRSYGNDEYEIIIKTDNYRYYRATENFARLLIDHANMVEIDQFNRVGFDTVKREGEKG